MQKNGESKILSVKKLVFLEFIDEADAYLSKNKNISDDTLFIALMPRIKLYLEKKGVRVDSTYGYFDNSSHAKVSLWVEEAIGCFEDALEIKDSSSISETYHNSFIYYLRFTFTYLAWVTEVIHNACKKHLPQEICACIQQHNQVTTPLISDQERYLGLICRDYSARRRIGFCGLDFKVNPVNENLKGGSNTYSNIFIRLAAKINLWCFARACQKPAILATGFSYGMPELFLKLQDSFSDFSWLLFIGARSSKLKIFLLMLVNLFSAITGIKTSLFNARVPINVVFPLDFVGYLSLDINDVQFNLCLNQTWKRIDAMPKQIFLFEDVFLGKLIKKRLSDGILPEIKRLHKMVAGMEKLVAKARPFFVLSPFSRSETFALGEICRLNEIPAMLISHGTHIPPKNRVEEIEHDHLGRGVINTEFPYTAAQSPWEVKYADHFKIKSKVVKTGPLLWSIISGSPPLNLKQLILGKKFADKRVVLHAATQKARESMRMHINETADEYIQEILDIFQAIKQIKEAVLVVKFRSTSNLSLKDLLTALPQSDQLIVVTKPSLVDLLSITDLLVSFQSTVIQEAILNRIPVLMYGGRGRYQHFPAFVVKPGIMPKKCSAYHAVNCEDLQLTLEWLLRNHSGRCLDDQHIREHLFLPDEKEGIIDFINKLREEKVSL